MALFGAKPEAEGKTGKIGKLGKLVNRKNIIFLIVMHAVSFALIYLLCERFGEHELVLHGNVEIRQVELSFRVDGRIEKILVDEGMRVEKGELLARLESDIYKARLDAAKAAVDTQRAQLGKLEAGYRVEEVEQAREQVRSAKAQADYAKIQLDRITSMHRQNAISQQALDNALSLARQSLANLAAAEQARDMHERGYRKEDIEAQKATLAAAEADLELARIALADCELRAPSSGVVLTRAQEEGAIVGQGSPLLTLTLSDPVWLRVYVDEPNLGHVKPGARVLVWADCSDAPFEGSIGYVSPASEFTPKNVETEEVRTSLVYRVRVLARDPKNMLRQGMPVRVTLKDKG